MATPIPTSPGPGSRRARALLADLVPAAAGALVILVAWWGAALVFARLRVIPTPPAVFHQMYLDRAAYLANGATTLREALVGFCWGAGFAVLLGAVFVASPFVERSLLRIAVASYCIPLVAVSPILVVVLPGDGPKEALAALAVFFSTLLCTIQGLRSANPSSLDLVRSLGGSGAKAFRLVRVPSALPSLGVALRIAAPAALLGAVIGEYFGASQGLGVALVQAQSSFEVERSWGFALCLALLAGTLYAGAALISRLAAPWAASEALAGSEPAGPGAPSRPARALRSAAFFVWSLLLAVALWYLLLRVFRLDHYFAKTPLDVWRYLFTDPEAPGNRRELAAAVGTTLGDAGIGYACGTVIAVLVAVAMVAAPAWERAVMPAAVFMRSIPLVAVTPLVALVFGRGLLGVTAIVSSVVFFPTLVYVLGGLRAAPRASAEVVTALGGSRLAVIRKVRFWYGLPSLFTSARNAIPAALGGAILAEWLATGQGAGNLLVTAYSESRFDTLWSGSVVLIVLSAGCYTGLGILETRVAARWGPAPG